MLKNEINLSTRKKNYEKEKLKLEDLTDKWISMLRRKKPITRKEVRLLVHLPVSFQSLSVCLSA